MITQLRSTQTVPSTPSDHPGIEPSAVPTAGDIAATKPDFVDISHHQGTVDWDAYAKDGYKLGACKLSEGEDFTDDKAADNRAAMSRLGLKCGVYHFARPKAKNMVAEANREADFYLKQLGTLGKNEFPILDFEVTNGLQPVQLTRWANTWCKKVQAATGKTPWLYTGKAIQHQLDPAKLGKYPLWLADYSQWDRDHPPAAAPWPTLAAWQYTDKFPFDGIGKSDGSYLYGEQPAEAR